MQSELRLRTLISVLVAVGLVAITGVSWVRAQKPGHGATWLHARGHGSAGASKKPKKMITRKSNL